MPPPKRPSTTSAGTRLLDELARRAQTVRGAALARALPLYDSLDAARARHEEVGEARALRDSASRCRSSARLGRARHRRGAAALGASRARSTPQSLRDVALDAGGGRARAPSPHRARAQAPRLLGRAALISDLDDVSGPILDALRGRPSGTVRLRDRASPALGGLRRNAQRDPRGAGAQAGAAARRHAHRAAPAGPLLHAARGALRAADPRRRRSQVRGIVHGTSQSGQTVFVEPEEMVDLNNRLQARRARGRRGGAAHPGEAVAARRGGAAAHPRQPRRAGRARPDRRQGAAARSICARRRPS